MQVRFLPSPQLLKTYFMTNYDKIQLILEATAKEYGVNEPDIKGLRRMRNLINPRFTVCILAYKRFTSMGLAEIGSFLGGRDHTTILNSINKGHIYLATEDEFRYRHDRILKEILPLLSVPGFKPQRPGLLIAKKHLEQVAGFIN